MAEVHKAGATSSTADEPIRPPIKKDIKGDGVIRPNGIKLKRHNPKLTKPGNWREGSVHDDKKPRTTDSPLSGTGATSPGTGPVVNQLDEMPRGTFPTGRPMEDKTELQKCKNCPKHILKSAMKSHLQSCLKKKKETPVKEKLAKPDKDKDKEKDKDTEKEKLTKAKEKKIVVGDEDGEGEDDEDAEGDEEPPKKAVAAIAGGIKSAKKSATKKTDAGADGEKKSKKRKADADAEKGPKPKKKKEDPKPKAPKPKGPVDVERQCGVITPNGVPCARSLTCKSHSMGAKRGVPGRSLPYDMLLAAYQKKNQAKQQKAAIDANAPLEDEDEANAGPVDSDEETAAVMNSLSRWNPRPFVEQPVLIPIKRQYQLARLREQLDNATSGGTVNIFKVVSKNGVPLSEVNGNVLGIGLDGEDAPGEPDYGIMGVGGSRRNSAISYGVGQGTGQGQRKSSQVSVRQ